MKYLKALNLLALSLCLSVASFAQPSEGGDTPPRERSSQKSHGGKGGNHQSRILQHLLEMDDAQLNELGTTIKRIQSMSPEEKGAMKQRLKKLNNMPREEVDAIRERFEAIPKEEREAMRQRWQEMSTEEREALREQVKNLPPEERRQFMQDKGILPPIPKQRERGQGMRNSDGKKGKAPNGERGPRGMRPNQKPGAEEESTDIAL